MKYRDLAPGAQFIIAKSGASTVRTKDERTDQWMLPYEEVSRVEPSPEEAVDAFNAKNPGTGHLDPEQSAAGGGREEVSPGPLFGPELKALYEHCEKFNEGTPVGMLMEFRDGVTEFTARTRSKAWVVADQEILVLLEGKRGGYCVEFLRPFQKKDRVLWDESEGVWICYWDAYGYGRASILSQAFWFPASDATRVTAETKAAYPTAILTVLMVEGGAES